MQGHLVARVARHCAHKLRTGQLQQANGAPEPNFDMPIWGKVIIGSTVVLFVLLSISLFYSIGHVIMTLTMVETPATETVIRVTEPSDDEDPDATLKGEKEGLLDPLEDVELSTITTKPITWTIRGTFRHITEQAGFRARWRGLGVGILYFVMRSLAAAPLMFVTRGLPGRRLIVDSLVSILFVRIHAAWTHRTVAAPSEKRLRDILLPRSMCWRQLAIPTAAVTTIPHLMHAALFHTIVGVERVSMGSKNRHWIMLASSIAVFIGAVFVDVFVTLPLFTARARMETSLLDAETDTIVPVDRTYGGKVILDRVTGSCALANFKAAFKSVDRDARRRIIKNYMVMTVVLFSVGFVGFHVVFFEALAIMGNKLPENLMLVQQKLQQHGVGHPM